MEKMTKMKRVNLNKRCFACLVYIRFIKKKHQ